MVNPKRIRQLNTSESFPGPVTYWMSRDQRMQDNWALLYAQQRAKEYKQPLSVIFCLAPSFLGATIRQYQFMLKGLQEIEKDLTEKNISFHLLLGNPEEKIPEFIKTHKIAALVTDFSPLKISKQWKTKISGKIDIPFYVVDTHNIVPCWEASDKQEFSARTIRPKITNLLPEFLTDFPSIEKHQFGSTGKSTDWEDVIKSLKIDTSVEPVAWIKPGEKAAHEGLKIFIQQKLSGYDANRNDITLDAQSNLSPYLHFGQISAQRVAWEVQKTSGNKLSKETFLEELIVRKELSDNFCFYNQNYDSPEGFPDWAKRSLKKHAQDKREYLYSLDQLEKAQTHDELWNAAQREMVSRGKMHGYMRMYWAKKILEWTSDLETAHKYAVYLNDKYFIDGRDPNGYTGIAWSLGGVHDRPWFERPIFGTIRYMNYNGAKKKFNIEKYITSI